MTIDILKDKNVAIAGLAIEGLALAEFLSGKVKSLTVLDQKNQEDLLNDTDKAMQTKIEKILDDNTIAKTFGPNYLDNLARYDIVFRSPAIYFEDEKLLEAKRQGVEISSQMNLFFELCPAKIIGVTGTKGKGTTSSLIFSILKKNAKSKVFLAGNIGYPAITLLPEISKDDFVVLELSNFQLCDLNYSPHIAVVTNLAVDHLNYHHSVEEYHKAKFNILKYQTSDDIAILNSNSTFTPDWLDESKAVKKYFSTNGDGDAVVRGDDGISEVILDPKNRDIKICAENEITLFGKHNLENVCAAALVADFLGVNENLVKEEVKVFKGLPHRTELIAEIEGVKYVNDSFATNPEPTLAAINSFTQNKILVLGGSSKGSDFNELANAIVKSNVSAIILIGQEAQKIKDSLRLSGYTGKIIEGASNMSEVVKQAHSIAQPGDVVLLSPACASFGMFKNYKDRGEKFRNCVLQLQAKD